MIITPKLKSWLIDGGHCEADGSDDYYQFRAAKLMSAGALTSETFAELSEPQMSIPTPEKVFGRGSPSDSGGSRIRVKQPSEAYSEDRYPVKSAKTGLPVFDPIHGRECMSMSEGSRARAGTFLKHLARKGGILNVPATEHEESLLNELCQKQAWCGRIGEESYDWIGPDRRIKALVDDATSAGLELVPVEMDADVITFPLLNGELYPLVDLRPVPRGRRIEGASIQTPTMNWGGSDNAEIALFNTNAMVAAIDTSIFAVDGSITIGRDFLSDSPVAVGELLVQLVGERLQQTLDYVIASGNGTTHPEGLFIASGVGSAPTDNGSSGPPTLADFTELLFTLPKQYRTPGNRVCFVSNDTVYARSRGIKVDSATVSVDQRPVLTGGDTTSFNNYSTLGFPHKIQNNLANTTAGIACMSKYRMYRRLGLDIRFESGGATLARNNLVLLIYRARFGGRLMDAAGFAKWTNGQT